jgi:leucyl-tRNA synthetase|eukprot:COSAG06_NODE_200_length_20386_cov_35.829547_12_plen_152_part_00
MQRRKGQKQEALRQAQHAQVQLSSVVAKHGAKVDKLRKISLAPIQKQLRKRANAIKRAKEFLAQEYAMSVATHKNELKQLDAIANAARSCAQEIELTRVEAQSTLKEKHESFMDTYVGQNEGFVGKVKELTKKDPRQENFAKMMQLLNASA